MAERETLRILRPKQELARDRRDFLLDAGAANRSPGTVRFYRQKLPPFLDCLQRQGVEQAADIGPGHLRAFLAGLAQDRTHGGVHAYWRAVRAFLRFLVREGLLAKDPTVNVRAPKVIAALKAEAEKPKGKAAADEIHYLEINKERMRYDQFRDAGCPIGSGTVESACKRLIAARIREPGMIWTQQGAQAILALRAELLSDRWDEAWRDTRPLLRAA